MVDVVVVVVVVLERALRSERLGLVEFAELQSG